MIPARYGMNPYTRSPKMTTDRSIDNVIKALAGTTCTPVLMLDYDGTLAPFVVERSKAFPYPGVVSLLERLRRDTSVRLVIVSGRPVADIVRLLGMEPPPEIWGCHGWERRHANGRVEVGEISPEADRAMQEARSWVSREGLEEQLEVKPASLALHWRGFAGAERDAIEAKARKAWSQFEGEAGLNIHGFDGGLELRLAGWSKADAVNTLCRESPEGAPMIYLGDDFTDEDAFKALPAGGVGVLVREQYRQTAADFWVVPPEGLLELLARLLSELTGSQSTGETGEGP